MNNPISRYDVLSTKYSQIVFVNEFLILKVIAATVASDPTQYSEAFLGKPNEEYCSWILSPTNWGGEYAYIYFSLVGF